VGKERRGCVCVLAGGEVDVCPLVKRDEKRGVVVVNQEAMSAVVMEVREVMEV
jgi:hypothetical protein